MRSFTLVSWMTICLAVVPLRAQSAAEARAGWDAAARKFEELFKRGDADAIGSIYTSDATFIEADGTRTKGRGELVKYLRGSFAAITVKDYSIHTSEFHSEGHVAYGIGTEHLAAVDKKTHKDIIEDLQFLVVFRQDPDKVWRMQYGMETPMPPKAKAP